MADFVKILNPGKLPCGRVNRKFYVSVSCKNGDLSISGVVDPRKNGSCAIAGQIHEELSKVIPSIGWTIDLLSCLQSIWERWHLNGLRAGSPKQEAYLRELEANGIQIDYETACDALKKAGIYEDEDCIRNGRPYRYGSAWLKEEVPAWVLDWLQSLPEAKTQPAWI